MEIANFETDKSECWWHPLVCSAYQDTVGMVIFEQQGVEGSHTGMKRLIENLNQKLKP